MLVVRLTQSFGTYCAIGSHSKLTLDSTHDYRTNPDITKSDGGK